MRQLCSVAADGRQAGIEAFLDSDAQLVRCLRFQQENVIQNLVDIYGREFQFCRAGQIKKLLNEFVHAIDFANHDVGKFQQR